MRVVVDTSVLVSAVFRDRVPQDVLLYIAVHPEIEWIASEAILAEYEAVLKRAKFALPPVLVRKWMDLLRALTVPVSTPQDIEFPRDPTDSKFIVCALTAAADFLITSDRDFEAARSVLQTEVISVGSFKRRVCDGAG